MAYNTFLADRIAQIEEIYDGKIKLFSFPSAKVRWEDCWAWMTENKRKPKKSFSVFWVLKIGTYNVLARNLNVIDFN